MKINKNNYEAYFVDYLEGNLDESLVDEFIEFIQQNPELKAEMELFNSISLEPEDFGFPGKDKLYKEKFDEENTFNHAAIAQLEGDLNEAEKNEFDKYLEKHPEKQKEAALFAQTKLLPDKSITFRKKNMLYHHSASRTVLLWSGRVAAVLVLAISVYLFTNNTSENIPESQVTIAENEKPEQEIATPEKIGESDIQNRIATESEKEITQPVAVPEKEEKPDSKPAESIITPPDEKFLAERTPEKAQTEQVEMKRTPIEIPSKITTLSAQVAKQKPQGLLASVDYHYDQIPETGIDEDERLIGDMVREKTGLENISLNKITKAGLKLVSSISKDNFTYETNASGEITEVNFDSRLLAFSIPTNNGE